MKKEKTKTPVSLKQTPFSEKFCFSCTSISCFKYKIITSGLLIALSCSQRLNYFIKGTCSTKATWNKLGVDFAYREENRSAPRKTLGVKSSGIKQSIQNVKSSGIRLS